MNQILPVFLATRIILATRVFLEALIFLVTLLCAPAVYSQDIGHEVPHDTLTKYGIYDFDLPPPSFHAERRELLLSKMSPGSVALFTSAPEQTRANDIEYQFHQDPDLYYLSGCTEPQSMLLLSKSPITLPDGRSTQEILFVQRRNPAQETWTGKLLGPQGAIVCLQVAYATTIDSLEYYLHQVMPHASLFTYDYWVPTVHDPVLDTTLVDKYDVTLRIPHAYPSVTMSSALITELHNMRKIKQPVELAMMRKAIAISNEAHNDVIANARPGWYEYQIQARAEGDFLKNGAEYTAYPCIVGSGPNSTILHYETNRRQTQAGDFIEMDMGAEYHGYAADVTRSFPISGTFTPEQRTIYSLVLEAQDSGIRLCKIGMPFRSAHNAAVRVIRAGLLRLGIIHDSASYFKYFMHGTSHFLGLDVHDVGQTSLLEAGNVLTVEPGIYIAEGSPCDKKWWNIGCRIEDDILVTDRGPEILSAGSPRTLPELQRLLSRKN